MQSIIDALDVAFGVLITLFSCLLLTGVLSVMTSQWALALQDVRQVQADSMRDGLLMEWVALSDEEGGGLMALLTLQEGGFRGSHSPDQGYDAAAMLQYSVDDMKAAEFGDRLAADIDLLMSGSNAYVTAALRFGQVKERSEQQASSLAGLSPFANVFTIRILPWVSFIVLAALALVTTAALVRERYAKRKPLLYYIPVIIGSVALFDSVTPPAASSLPQVLSLFS